LFTLNIGNIMQIQPLSWDDLIKKADPQAEIAREPFVEKVCLLVVSYFCAATEYRFMSQSNPNSPNSKEHGKLACAISGVWLYIPDV